MEITPITKRIMLIIMGLVALITTVGFAFGDVDIKDALLVILPLFTGFFSLLKGME